MRPSAAVPGTRRLLALLLGVSVVVGAIVGELATSDQPALALVFPLLLVPVLLWRSPRLGVYLLFAAAVTIEQFPYDVGPRPGALTSRIPFFQGGLPGGAKAAELLLLLTAVIVVMQAVQRRQAWFHRSAIAQWLAAFICIVSGFLVVGVGRGGDFAQALWEVRAYFYLAVAYMLASSLIGDLGAVRPLAWILVIGSAVKAAYGLAIFLSVRHIQPRPEAVLGHEESFFIGLYVVVAAGLWVFSVRDRLRTVATALLPVVILGDLVNSRRTAWLILGVGLALLTGVAYARMPHRRKAILSGLAVLAVAAAAYLPAFWSKGGTLAQPARAVRSIVMPDIRDESSNAYREIENYNIEVLINGSHSLGTGYGIRITYFGLVDLTEATPLLAYVPHNGVLHIWMRTGIVGMVVFSVFLVQAMISAIRLTASRRRAVALVGAVAGAALSAFVVMGVVDMGFFWLRNAIAMGIMLGVVDGLARTERADGDAQGGPGSVSGRTAVPVSIGGQL